MSSYICFKKQKVLYLSYSGQSTVPYILRLYLFQKAESSLWEMGRRPVSLTRAVCSAKIKTLWKGVRAVEGGGLENR